MTKHHIQPLNYATHIDTPYIGPDFGEEGGGFGARRQNGNARALTMIFQSLPETRRKISEGNTSFVEHNSGFSDEPENLSRSDSDRIIMIRPVPVGLDKKTLQSLEDKACAELNPELFAQESENIDRLKVKVAEAFASIEALKADARDKINSNGDSEFAKSVRNEFLEKERGLNGEIRGLRHSIEVVYEQRNKNYGFAELRQAIKEKTAPWVVEQAQPLIAMLTEAGIEHRVTGEGLSTRIELDQQQPDFEAKLSALMDTHREAILEHYKDADFVIPKPDGTALDKEQAAAAIAKRLALLEADRAQINATAEKYGVSNMVDALGKNGVGGGWVRGSQHGH